MDKEDMRNLIGRNSGYLIFKQTKLPETVEGIAPTSIVIGVKRVRRNTVEFVVWGYNHQAEGFYRGSYIRADQGGLCKALEEFNKRVDRYKKE